MVTQHFILLASMDIFQLLIIFAHVVLTWKHGMHVSNYLLICLRMYMHTQLHNNIYTHIATHVYIIHICMYNCLFHISGGEDGTPLACAASKGHVKVINYLLGQNVDVNGGIKVCNLKLITINISNFV